MKLFELFNKSAELKITTETLDDLIAAAKIDNKQMIYRFSQIDVDEDLWDFSFSEKSSFNNHGITGTGKEFEVFATAKKFLEIAIKKYKPEIFQFSSLHEEHSRTKLYNSLVKKLKIPGYSFDASDGDDEYNEYKLYHFVKNK